jgi:hypothetical protein
MNVERSQFVVAPFRVDGDAVQRRVEKADDAVEFQFHVDARRVLGR